MPTERVNGIEMYFERSGTGARLLFLNGSGSTLATSAPLVEVFAGRFDVVAHDQRGLGRTETPPGPYAMADYAADAVGLLDLLGWTSCRVVGVSFGGMVAQEMVVTAPERFERLALLCTSPGGDGGSSFPVHELPGLPAGERADKARHLLDTRFSDEWLTTHPGDRRLVDLVAARASASGSGGPSPGETDLLEARRRHDVWDRLDRITSPTFVAAGRFDGIAPLANSEAMASRIAGATVHVYDGGHAFFAQDRRALPEILDFLDT